MEVNLEKTEYIIFNNNEEVEHYPFTYNNTPIIPSQDGQFKYLGIILDHNTIYEPKLTKNKQAAAQATHKIHTFANTTNLTQGSLYLNLYKIMIRSKLWYGLEFWAPPLIPNTITLKPLGILNEMEQ